MKKIIRNMSDPTSQAYWESMNKSASDVRDWPDWKKAGINFEQPGVPRAAVVPMSGRLDRGFNTTGE